MSRNFTPVSKGAVTITNASPAVCSTVSAHGLSANQVVVFTTTGTLPTGLTATTTYYVIATGLTATDFRVATSVGGTAINTSSAGSGTHTCWLVDDYLTTANVSVTAYPLTMSAWVYVNANTTDGAGGAALTISSSSSSTDYLSIGYTVARNPRLTVRSSSPAANSDAVDSGTTIATGVWTHLCGAYTDATTRTLYVNGVSSVTNSTSVTPVAGNLNTTCVGALRRANSFRFIDAKIAHVAIWNVALSATEVAALYGGADPRTIQSSGLVNYVPMTGNVSPETDTQQSYTFTVNGTTFDTDNTISGRNPYVQKARVNAAPTRSAIY